MSVILGQYAPALTTYAYKAKQDNCGSEYSTAHANEYFKVYMTQKILLAYSKELSKWWRMAFILLW